MKDGLWDAELRCGGRDQITGGAAPVLRFEREPFEHRLRAFLQPLGFGGSLLTTEKRGIALQRFRVGFPLLSGGLLEDAEGPSIEFFRLIQAVL